MSAEWFPGSLSDLFFHDNDDLDSSQPLLPRCKAPVVPEVVHQDKVSGNFSSFLACYRRLRFLSDGTWHGNVYVQPCAVILRIHFCESKRRNGIYSDSGLRFCRLFLVGNLRVLLSRFQRDSQTQRRNTSLPSRCFRPRNKSVQSTLHRGFRVCFMLDSHVCGRLDHKGHFGWGPTRISCGDSLLDSDFKRFEPPHIWSIESTLPSGVPPFVYAQMEGSFW